MNLLIKIIDIAFEVYGWLIIARVLLSWVRHNPYQPAIRFIYEMTEPFLNFFRRIIPPLGIIDISPIIALFALQILHVIVLRIILLI